MGGKVGPNDQGWEVAVCDINLTEKGREIFGLEKLVCLPLAEVLQQHIKVRTPSC
jgi:hypothetical protein